MMMILDVLLFMGFSRDAPGRGEQACQHSHRTRGCAYTLRGRRRHPIGVILSAGEGSRSADAARDLLPPIA
jgi:hypothetical protein